MIFFWFVVVVTLAVFALLALLAHRRAERLSSGGGPHPQDRRAGLSGPEPSVESEADGLDGTHPPRPLSHRRFRPARLVAWSISRSEKGPLAPGDQSDVASEERGRDGGDG